MLPLKWAGTKPTSLGLSFHLTNLFGLAMSMFMLMLACSNIQYCDETFNGAKVICKWLFRERVHFYKIPSYS